jgi:hypothetical protein
MSHVWLIEGESLTGETHKPNYYCFSSWSLNAYEAVWFVRKEDAERALTFLNREHWPIHGAGVCVRQHSFE